MDGRERQDESGWRQSIFRELDQIRSSIGDLNRKIDTALLNRITAIEIELGRIDLKKYVTKDEFRPIQKLVWGVVTTVIGIVVTAIIGLIIKGGGVLK